MNIEPTTIKMSTVARVLGKGIEYFRNKRTNKLVEALALGNIDIDDKLVNSESFLSSFITTVDAIQKASGHKKIAFLTELFINGYKHGYIDNFTDQFHELLNIIAGLSETEIIVLARCDGNLTKAVFNLDLLNQDEPQNKSVSLYNKVAKELGVTEGEAVAYVSGLQRTGFIIPMVKVSPYPIYLLSEKYETLKKYILHMNEFY